MLNPYESIEAKIENIITETPDIKTFVLKPKEKMSFSAGQFIMLTVKGIGEAPFMISSSPYETNLLEVTAANVGRVTNRLHHLKKSNIVGIRGPYGKGYPIDRLYGRQIAIIAAGIGMAGLRSLLSALLAQKERFKRIILLFNAKTPQDIVYKDAFAMWMSEKRLEVQRSVERPDSSWKEAEGGTGILLDKLQLDPDNSAAVISGPAEVMQLSVSKLIKKGHKPENIYLSLERNMSCGFGKCGHCGFGRFYVCKDGPVFTYKQIKDINEPWN